MKNTGRLHKKHVRNPTHQRNQRVFFMIVILLFLTGIAVLCGRWKEKNITADAKSAEMCSGRKWEEIFSHSEIYPESFLKALERNSEILDFVAEYPTSEPKSQGGISFKERLEKTPLFLQWDKRWGYVPYGQNNIGISGCGPTCLSMVLYSFTRNRELTPDVLAGRAMKEGYYVDGIGTSWSFMADVSADYGIYASQFTILKEIEMRDRLNDGNLIICAMGPGDFTDQGHFIVIRGYSGGGFYVNDPFSNANSKKVWAYETLSGQIQQTWVYAK